MKKLITFAAKTSTKNILYETMVFSIWEFAVDNNDDSTKH
jgi:hypothetical protein